MQTRTAIRQYYRQCRRGLSNSEQQQASVRVHEQIAELMERAPVKCIAAYLANDGEVDLTPVIHHCWRHDIQVCLPVLHPFSPGNLLFLRYHSDSQMMANHYGIAEPALRCPDVVPLAHIDLMLTPLVAFDEWGNRLGMGGGFYDRTLAAVERHQYNTRVVGVAHDCQKAQKLPIEAWDKPLQGIITPSVFLSF
ncbi:5-formyltetrahydrofolate cyclo-ligase [Aestuariibacter salexigens]|uniref:5-formyltetrahydrofolate cyclo-ligase n=1 Tax=Aestuariibacter salexigens TaxID=226010 RepID=UPI0004285EA3|nr:5-formyltetrahydrofolate cyclo-ligase [Aestuariibacter salexigens]